MHHRHWAMDAPVMDAPVILIHCNIMDFVIRQHLRTCTCGRHHLDMMGRFQLSLSNRLLLRYDGINWIRIPFVRIQTLWLGPTVFRGLQNRAEPRNSRRAEPRNSCSGRGIWGFSLQTIFLAENNHRVALLRKTNSPIFLYFDFL